MTLPTMKPADRDVETESLAKRHYEIEEGVTQIFILQDRAEADVVRAGPAKDPVIRLLEVNENTPPSGIVPLGFAPHPASGIHFPSVIVEVTPQELNEIKANRLSLPNGWVIGPLIPRPDKQNE
jgi:hypothetical protein